MPRFKASTLRTYYQSEQRFFSEQKRTMLNESQRPIPHFDIFLSHSYLDRQVIGGLFIALSRMGYNVYVDWIVDPTLDRSSVNKKTADKIKKRMEQSDTLFHATSTNTTKSNWMPWETGFMDSLRDKCAIVEIEVDSSTTFRAQEYLLLYPFASEEGESYNPSIYINNRDTKRKIPFALWKSGLKP